MVTPESIQGAMAESEQELTHELTAVRAQLQQVVSRLGSIEGKKIRFSLWQNLVCSLNLTFLLRISKTRNIDEQLSFEARAVPTNKLSHRRY